MIAEPLEMSILEDLEAGVIPSPAAQSSKEISSFFVSNLQKYGWDLLSARSLWAFGPSEERGPNVLLNEYLPAKDASLEVRSLISSPNIREAITQGFHWACREGPLCDERMQSFC